MTWSVTAHAVMPMRPRSAKPQLPAAVQASGYRFEGVWSGGARPPLMPVARERLQLAADRQLQAVRSRDPSSPRCTEVPVRVSSRELHRRPKARPDRGTVRHAVNGSINPGRDNLCTLTSLSRWPRSR
jgi:hypothetical protein